MTNDLKVYLFRMLDSVLDSKSAAYVAGPLATGQNYYELLAAGRSQEAENIRPVNNKLMQEYSKTLRGRLKIPVLDPSLLVVDEWTGQEMGGFFIATIQKYSREVWFMDGWEYSRGATKEFQICQESKIVCYGMDGAELTKGEGVELIEKAAKRIHALGLDAEKFRNRVSEIKSMVI